MSNLSQTIKSLLGSLDTRQAAEELVEYIKLVDEASAITAVTQALVEADLAGYLRGKQDGEDGVKSVLKTNLTSEME